MDQIYTAVVEYVLRTARRDMRIALGLVGGLVLWFHEPLMQADPFWGIVLTALAGGAAVLGFWCIGEMIWLAIPTIRFAEMSDEVDRLAGEFGACAEDGSDGPRFSGAVSEAVRLSGRLARLGVPLEVDDADTGDPEDVVRASSAAASINIRTTGELVSNRESSHAAEKVHRSTHR